MKQNKKPNKNGRMTLRAAALLGLGMATLAVALAPSAQAGLYWWVGPCNGALANREINDAGTFGQDVQGQDPLAATTVFSIETAANAGAYSDCIVAGTDRLQYVTAEFPSHTVIVEECTVACPVAWDGEGRLTLTCLDDGETVVWENGNFPSLSHRCVVQSTLEYTGSPSVAVWKTILV